MDPSLFSLGSEELKLMVRAALNLNRRVIHAGDDDGNRLGEAGVPGSRDRRTRRRSPEKTIHAIDVTYLLWSTCRRAELEWRSVAALTIGAVGSERTATMSVS